MRTINLFTLTIIVCLVCMSCDNNAHELYDYVSDEQAEEIMLGYTTVEVSSFRLDLTKDKAMVLGVSPDYYEYYCSCMNEVNQMAEAILCDYPDVVFVKTENRDYNKSDFYNNVFYEDRTRGLDESQPSDALRTNGQEQVRTKVFFLPGQYNSFKCLFMASAPLALFNFNPIFGASNPQVFMAKGAGIHRDAIAEVECSAVEGYITFNTSDSNGGYCGFVAHTY